MASRRGFRDTQTFGVNRTVRNYRVNTDANNAFAIGDVVTLTASGQVTLVTAAGQAALGTIVGCYRRTTNGNQMPLTFNQPAAGPYLATAQDGYVDVIIGEGQIYEAAYEGTVTQTLIGVGMNIRYAGPDTRTGISGSSLASAVTTSADATFQCVGFSPREQVENPDGDGTKVRQWVQVKINNYRFNSPV